MPESADPKPEEKSNVGESENMEPNLVTPEEEQAENDLYKLREDFYRSQNICQTNMISLESSYRTKVGPNMTVQQVTVASPLILLGSSVQVGVWTFMSKMAVRRREF